MWIILVFVSNPKAVTVFIFGHIIDVQKVDDTKICAFKIRLI